MRWIGGLFAFPVVLLVPIGVLMLVPVIDDGAAKAILPGSSCNDRPCSLEELRLGLGIGAFVCLGMAALFGAIGWNTSRRLRTAPPRTLPSAAARLTPPAPVLGAAAPVPAPAPRRDAADRMLELKELREKGLVSEQEYARERARLLDEL
jgi:hypothetical protein